MATATKTKTKVAKVVAEVTSVVLTPTGIRVGSKGKVQKASEFFANNNDKGLNRKVRKLLYAEGRVSEAATRRN